MGPFISNIIVTDGDEATFLAAEPVLNCEALSAAVGEGLGSPSIANGQVVVPLGLGELGAPEAIRDGGEPGTRGDLPLHSLFDLGSGPGQEGIPEGLIAFLPCVAVGGAGIADAAAVVV